MKRLISLVYILILTIMSGCIMGSTPKSIEQSFPAVEVKKRIPDEITPVPYLTLLNQELKSNVDDRPKKPASLWTEDDVEVLSKMLWGEARGVVSDTEKAACVWCVLNRVDLGQGSIIEVTTSPLQFIGYREDNPVDSDLKALCEDVLIRWSREKTGESVVGRVLPPDYLFFRGDGRRNHFRNAYQGGDSWDWSYESPYES